MPLLDGDYEGLRARGAVASDDCVTLNKNEDKDDYMKPVVRIPQIYHEAKLPTSQMRGNEHINIPALYEEIREKESLGVRKNGVSIKVCSVLYFVNFSLQ